MFDYTHQVKDSKGAEWGLFRNKGQASIMQEAMASKFKHIQFFVEEVK